MSSNTRRHNNIHPDSPLAMMEASMQSGIDSIQQDLDRSKKEEQMILGKCSYCGKQGGDSVKNCSRCKAARYCDQTCQLADFKARHKRECGHFTHPPTTSVFLTEPAANERYAKDPVFASGHEDSVGCWVSIGGQIDCNLDSLAGAITDPASSEFRDRQERIATGPNHGRDMIRRHKAAARSLLSLRVLVQNRRKDKEPILVFGSRMQVVSYGQMTGAMARGVSLNDNSTTFVHDRTMHMAVGVAKDPWDKVPRLQVTYVNGQEVPSNKASIPTSIKDAPEGIVALKMGEYAIFRVQFRVGDGDTISKDWEALACLETIVIPYAIWDGTSSPATLASSLPQADTQPSSGPGRALHARFDQAVVKTHYAEYVEHGEEAYIRAHFGDARADMTSGAEKMMEMMGEMLLGSVAQAGNTGVLVQRLRDMGMNDIAEKIAARGR
ncbi:hypothetical protein L226DRAFT_613017 [Lentinus tigrinus ALCF2SS1-7]|uniref:MYND-type domain-containing protein n=1 Tax=Lentinus tigrinus ALCF2SS1-6 TaxID=1328759 RepID=A0A5C2S9T6_9APHY|nr:hypothetical protein L227DRAFT_653541 [Lentinus tigrinus ALCF2SS1-6]RPD74758.1 hypothetical protein L226DRAFT_613017 [Lentinus tigrinus ALCF2SS1-7]